MIYRGLNACTCLPNKILFPEHNTQAAPQDSFYRELSPEEAEMADAKMFDFDAPEALDMALLMDCIARLRVGGWVAECEGVGP